MENIILFEYYELVKESKYPESLLESPNCLDYITFYMDFIGFPYLLIKNENNIPANKKVYVIVQVKNRVDKTKNVVAKLNSLLNKYNNLHVLIVYPVEGDSWFLDSMIFNINVQFLSRIKILHTILSEYEFPYNIPNLGIEYHEYIYKEEAERRNYLDTNSLTVKKKYKLAWLNAKKRKHRILMHDWAIKNNLHKDNVYSWLGLGKKKDYKTKHSISTDPNEPMLFWPGDCYDQDQWLPRKEVLESYFNVVSETFFYENQIYITEKTWKPVHYGQPFIIIGPAYILKYLRQIGYKTFNDYIDESYDQEVDPDTRLEKVKTLIQYINRVSFQELDKLHRDVYPIIEHNRTYFTSRKYKEEINRLYTFLK